MDDIKTLFERPLPSARNGAFFNTFSYPTKISPESIAVYIAASTKPGETVLDTFGGSGSTGIAALLCEHPTDRMKALASELSLEPVWGARNAIGYEIGTYGSFAAQTISNRLKANEFKKAVTDFVDKEKEYLMHYYSAVDPNGEVGTIRYIIWSEVLLCPYCGGEISYFENGTKRNPVVFEKDVTCPHCKKKASVDDMKYQTEKYTDGMTGKSTIRKKRIPSWVYGTTNGQNWDRSATDNPYKKTLQRKTDSFGIKPPGASHLHMELATTFLLASIDKYLKDGARWMCVMPGSILSGYHHDPLRLENYKDSAYVVDTNIDTIWELPISTFKNKAVVLGGKRTNRKSEYPISGRVYEEPDLFDECNYTLNKQGNRSAWTNKGENAEFLDVINENPWEFNQGADIMPRTALFHDFSQLPNGTWSIRKIENTSELYYLLSDSHKDVCRDLVADGFSNDYMYDCLISKHLSPFSVSEPAKVILPGKRIDGRWRGLSDEEIALLNSGTSYSFTEIQAESRMPLSAFFDQKINIRKKLDKQSFGLTRWLVLSNAGGTNPCAAYIDLNNMEKKKLIIDQTLYWYLAESEEEALYIVGILNSVTLSNAISDFQPQGGFGARHIHTIPYKIIPRFDISDDAHMEVVANTQELINEWAEYCSIGKEGKYLSPNSGSLNSRRRKLQAALKTMASYDKYEEACSGILCTE